MHIVWEGHCVAGEIWDTAGRFLEVAGEIWDTAGRLMEVAGVWTDSGSSKYIIVINKMILNSLQHEEYASCGCIDRHPPHQLQDSGAYTSALYDGYMTNTLIYKNIKFWQLFLLEFAFEYSMWTTGIVFLIDDLRRDLFLIANPLWNKHYVKNLDIWLDVYFP